MAPNSRFFVPAVHNEANLFNKADKLSIFRQYLEELHDEWQIIVSSTNVFNLKTVNNKYGVAKLVLWKMRYNQAVA